MRFEVQIDVNDPGFWAPWVMYSKSNFPELPESFVSNSDERRRQIDELLSRYEREFRNLAVEQFCFQAAAIFPESEAHDAISYVHALADVALTVDKVFSANKEFLEEEFETPLELCRFATHQMLKVLYRRWRVIEQPLAEGICAEVAQLASPVTLPLDLVYQYYTEGCKLPSREKLRAAAQRYTNFWAHELFEFLMKINPIRETNLNRIAAFLKI